jgi:hypothetical protein
MQAQVRVLVTQLQLLLRLRLQQVRDANIHYHYEDINMLQMLQTLAPLLLHLLPSRQLQLPQLPMMESLARQQLRL